MTRPTANDIDALAQVWQGEKNKVEAAKQTLAAVEDELVRMIERHGLAAKGEKSKVLPGEQFEIVGTFGHSTEVNEAGVLKLQAAMVMGGAGGGFKRLFSRDIRWSLRRGAVELARELPARFRGLFEQAVKTASRKPSITVRRRKALEMARAKQAGA